MNWGSISAFVAMGGYGLYVWGSYLIALALVIGEIGFLVARHRGARLNLGQKNSNRH